ncbi:MAG: DUF368 domain-containing protein [Candidatus Eutrophobiaceae bacterium]
MPRIELADRLRHAFYGLCIGTADIIPGVSGGTMAWVLGIYARLIAAIRSFDLEFARRLLHCQLRGMAVRHDLLFLFCLGSGMICAIIFFTKVISVPTLIVEEPECVYGMFFGLVGASCVTLSFSLQKPKTVEWGFLAAGLLAGLAVIHMVPAQTPETSLFIFISGMLAIMAMLLPGISGSYVLLLLKKYAFIMQAIADLNFAILIPFALGAFTAILGFSRLLFWSLEKYRQKTIYAMLGLLISSMWVLWPFQDRKYSIAESGRKLISSEAYWPSWDNEHLLGALSMAIIGSSLVAILHRLANPRSENP